MTRTAFLMADVGVVLCTQDLGGGEGEGEEKLGWMTERVAA